MRKSVHLVGLSHVNVANKRMHTLTRPGCYGMCQFFVLWFFILEYQKALLHLHKERTKVQAVKADFSLRGTD